jgi:nitrogen fixation protein
MTKISIYNKDTDVRGNDKWIGSDAQNQNRTKNFTPDNVAVYFNENQVIDLGVELRYFYDTLDPLQERVYGSITFETEIGPQVNFSAISTFILSKYTMGHTDVSQFLDFLVGSNVILSRSNNINMFGYYKIDSIEPYIPDLNFFVVTLTFENGNGYMKEDEDYFVSLVQFDQEVPDIPTKTSDLINDGEDGIHPFITADDVPTPTLQSVTDEGDTTTTTVHLDGGALSDSINEQASFQPHLISTVNKNTGSGVELGSTGYVGISPDGVVGGYFAAEYVTEDVTLQVPNKPTGTYFIATVEDLPTKTSDLTNDGEDGVNPFITAADIPPVTGFVPYTGATANVDLGEYEIKAGQVTLDTSPTGTAAVATTRWNDTIGSTETTLKGGSVLLKNGVDLVARVVNKVTPNATLTKAAYQAVRISGAQGQRLAVAYAQANNDNNSADTIGIVCETIATNQEGFILTVGQLEEINTTGSLQGETWADGDVLYLSPTTAGRLTNIKPTGATGHIVVMGYVEYAHAIHGKIYVKIMNGWELDELHNVFINSPANNEGLFYDSADSLWKNETIASALGYTPVTNARTISTSAPLSGGGDLNANRTLSITQATTSTNGYLSSTDWTTFNNKFTLPSLTSGSVLFSNGTTIAQDNAQLFWDDTNNRLGIGTNNPSAYYAKKLVVACPDEDGVTILANTVSSTNYLAFADGVTGNEAFRGYVSYKHLTDQLTFGAAGSLRMTLTSGGNLLLNTTTDAGFKLDVNGTARVSGNLGVNSGSEIYSLGQVGRKPFRLFTANGDKGCLRLERDGTINVNLSSDPAQFGASYISNSNLLIGTTTDVASSRLTVESTTQGFLPPRMTTTQKNAIATPAAGLVVYDTTLGKLCVRTAAAWETITSI